MEKFPNESSWTSAKVQDFVSAAVKKVKVHLTSELKKQLPIADPKHSSDFLQQIRNHYEIREDDPEMSQEKLYYLATSAMVPTMKVKWLERWNQPSSLREQVRFPKSKFADHDFPEWLHKATWWSQV